MGNLRKRLDGKYEETLSASWSAEYSEDADTGLWRVDLYRHDVAEWVSVGYGSLEDAREAARLHHDQT